MLQTILDVHMFLSRSDFDDPVKIGQAFYPLSRFSATLPSLQTNSLKNLPNSVIHGTI